MKPPSRKTTHRSPSNLKYNSSLWGESLQLKHRSTSDENVPVLHLTSEAIRLCRLQTEMWQEFNHNKMGLSGPYINSLQSDLYNLSKHRWEASSSMPANNLVGGTDSPVSAALYCNNSYVVIPGEHRLVWGIQYGPNTDGMTIAARNDSEPQLNITSLAKIKLQNNSCDLMGCVFIWP